MTRLLDFEHFGQAFVQLYEGHMPLNFSGDETTTQETNWELVSVTIAATVERGFTMGGSLAGLTYSADLEIDRESLQGPKRPFWRISRPWAASREQSRPQSVILAPDAYQTAAAAPQEEKN